MAIEAITEIKRVDFKTYVMIHPGIELADLGIINPPCGWVAGEMPDELWGKVKGRVVPLARREQAGEDEDKAQAYLDKTTETLGKEAKVLLVFDSAGYRISGVSPEDLRASPGKLLRKIRKAREKGDDDSEKRFSVAYLATSGFGNLR